MKKLQCMIRFLLRNAMLVYAFLILFSGFLPSCKAQNHSNFHYSISSPSERFLMGEELTEISGIAYLSTGLLACEQDEKGVLYFYDLNKRNVSRKIKFGAKGDYEDVAIVGNTAYLLRSDGTLFIFPINKGDEPGSREIHTPLSEKNNTEGLCYNSKRQELLLACKSKGGIEDDKLKGKAIYAFDLKTETLATKPRILIEKKQVHKLLAEEIPTSDIDLKDALKPSGISINPVDNKLYLLASKGDRQKLLCILSLEGVLEQVIELPSNLFAQPEGICFAPDGTMFISNEGREGRGTILKFTYQK